MKDHLAVLVMVLLATFASGQLKYDHKVDWSLPEVVLQRFEEANLLDTYQLSDKINPFYLRGDFDGDGVPDYAILVEQKKTHKIGIAIVRSKAAAVEVLGTGGILVRAGAGTGSYLVEDYNWMDAWQVQRKRTLEVDDREGSDKHPGPMVSEGLLVEKTESASAIIYFDGKRYRWYQLGD